MMRHKIPYADDLALWTRASTNLCTTPPGWNACMRTINVRLMQFWESATPRVALVVVDPKLVVCLLSAHPVVYNDYQNIL
ncbi:hypothetical protein BsWGS_10225 [Bradybaena similaris]